MLLGQYEGKVDEKARIALPKKFREILGSEIIITQGYENSLIIVSKSSWRSLLEGTSGRPFIEYETRQTQRFLLGSAYQAILDSKGRALLPNYLRTFAGIENDIVFVGLSRYVEIWDSKHWKEYQIDLSKNIEKISDRLVRKQKKEEGSH